MLSFVPATSNKLPPCVSRLPKPGIEDKPLDPCAMILKVDLLSC